MCYRKTELGEFYQGLQEIYYVLLYISDYIMLELFTVVPSKETEVTSTPTRPVDNVVITTKGLQDRNIKDRKSVV